MKSFEFKPVIVCNEGAFGNYFWRGNDESKLGNFVQVEYELAKKRLKYAECAAEYWRAELDESGAWGNTYPHHDENSNSWDRYMNAQTKANTWYQFATTPHAFGGES